jgi:hypothetical protein
MNFIDNLRATAGQKFHEQMYGAQLRIFGKELPCATSGIINDFALMEGGKSLKNFVEQITFRAEALSAAVAGTEAASYTPAKEVQISLLLANATAWVDLKLGMGGLLADGLTYKFMAYDRNYMA